MDSKRPSLKVNLLLNLLYEILTIVTPLITAPYVSRVLQADGVGIHSYTSSLLTYFTLFAALGTASYGKRVIAGLRDNKEACSKAFWEIEIITVFTTGICLIVWLIFASLYVEYRPYMLVLSFTLIATLFDISWLYGGLEKFQYTVSVNSICKILSVICIFLFVKEKDDVLIYTAIMSFATLLGNISMWLFLPKQIIRTKIDVGSMKHHLKETTIYFGPAIATSIYTVLDKTLIGVITNDNAQNGYYEQATKIINIVKSVSFNAINGVMMARASFLYAQKDERGLEKLRDVTYHLTSILSIGACFGLIGVSSVFVPLFFGDGYDQVVILIDILAVVVVVIGLSSVANTLYYIAGDNMKKATKLILIGSATNLVFNLVLIPKFQSYGAAIATLIAETVITVLFINGTKGFIKWNDIFKLTWKKVCAGMVMLASIMLVGLLLAEISNYAKLAIEVLIGAMVYFMVLLVLRDSSVQLGVQFIKEKIGKGANTNV